MKGNVLTPAQSKFLYQVFLSFSEGRETMDAVHLYKFCKVCRIYPDIISFDKLKNIIIKKPQYWKNKAGK